MKITPAVLKSLRTEIDAAVAEVAKRHGITFKTGSASYTENRFTFKLEGSVIGAQSVDAERYERSRAMLSLPALGTGFRSGNRSYKTAGLNSTGSKVLCTRDDGRDYLIPTDTCISLCKTAATA